jgi:hypothetical protein
VIKMRRDEEVWHGVVVAPLSDQVISNIVPLDGDLIGNG